MKALTTIIGLFLGLALSQSALSVGGYAYKCTAEDGSISFLDKEPHEGCVSVEKVKIHGTLKKDSEEDVAAEQEEIERQAVAEREEQNRKDCTDRQKTLDILKGKNRVIVTDPETGEKKPLSAEEHQAEIKKYQDYIDSFCSGKEETE